MNEQDILIKYLADASEALKAANGVTQANKLAMQAANDLAKAQQRAFDIQNPTQSTGFKQWLNQLEEMKVRAALVPAQIAKVRQELDLLGKSGQANSEYFKSLTRELASLERNGQSSTGGLRNFNQIVQQSSYQLQDFIIQVSGGVSAIRAFGQQAPQLLGAFGGVGAAIGVVVALGAGIASLILGMGDAKSQSDKFAESLAKTSNAMDDLNKAVDQFDATPLIDEFNKAGVAARKGLVADTELRIRKIGDEITELQGKLADFAQNQTKYKIDLAKSFGETDVQAIQTTIESLRQIYSLSKDEANELFSILKSIGAGTGDLAALTIRAEQLLLQTKQGRDLATGLREGTNEIDKRRIAIFELNRTLDQFRETPAFAKVDTGIDVEQARRDIEAAKAAAAAIKARNAEVERLEASIDKLLLKDTAVTDQLRDQIANNKQLTEAERERLTVKLEMAEAMERIAEAEKLNIEDAKYYAKILADSDKEIAAARKEQADAAKKALEDSQKFVENLQKQAMFLDTATGKVNTSMMSLYDTILKLRDAQSKGIISEEETRRLEEVAKSIAAAKQEMVGMDKLFEELGNKVDGYAKSFAGLFVELATSSKSASEAFSDFAEKFLKDMAQMITQILIMEPLVRAMVDAIKGSSFGSWFSSILPFSAPVSSSISAGAVASRTSIGAANVLASNPINMGSTAAASNVEVNIINNTQSEVSVQETTGLDGTKILNVMIEKKVKEMFGGGAMDKTMRSNYGVRRMAMG